MCFLLAILLTGVGNAIVGQEKENEITVKAQVRPRAEYRHGAINPMGETSQASSFIWNRARLSVGYDNGFVSMGLSVQDVSVWGERQQVESYPYTTGINEAWAKIYKDGFFAQLGRQQLSYDDERILGTLDWHQAGRWHDALKLGYENPNNKLHLILTYNQEGVKVNAGTGYLYGGQPYKTMQTGWYQFDNKENFTASLLLMNLGFEAGDVVNGRIDTAKTTYMQTIGANLSYKINEINLYGSVYLQTGKMRNDKSVSAYMFAAKAQYNITPKLTATAGLDYLSGQKNDSEDITAFNPLFGTHHKFYGAMDYFYASAYPALGLVDLYASLTVKPVKKLTLDVAYHNFSTQQPVISDNILLDTGKALGSEIDLTATYAVRPYVTLQGGFSVMFGTDTFFAVKGGSKDVAQYWGFLALNVNPTIFKGKF